MPLNDSNADLDDSTVKAQEAAEPPGADAFSRSRRQFLIGSAALAGAALVGSQVLAAGATATTGTSRVPRPIAPVFNRAPLAAVPFQALPLGSVEARGWLLTQLELQRDGLTGHAEEVLDATHPNSAWKGGDGEDWEKGPYYLKGLVPLAYTLDDAGLKAKVQAWIEPILASQRDDGFFGPRKNDDWWPRMVATYLLRDYAEATGDARVMPFLTRYYRHMSENIPTRPLREWGRARAGDEIDTVLWLYNRTGDAFLMPLADLLHGQAFPWRQIFLENRFLDSDDEAMTSHNVNVPQALKMPVVYYQKSKNEADRTAYYAGIANLQRDHGTSFGINSGTERLSGRSSFEGVETCSIVEKMLSQETALRILGDPKIGDELEFLAFNALPAALSKSIRQHVYFTLANNVTAPRGGVGYEQDYSDGRTPAPRSGYPCCCYNLHMGWPKLAQNAWAATPNGGLAALYYVPSQVNAQVGGNAVSLVCETNYPFEETIALGVSLEKSARFPLQLRVPAWCRKPQIKVNGRVQSGIVAGTFATLNRQWKTGDRVEIRFPMSVQSVRSALGSVSLRRGPLLYSLPLAETWTAYEKGKLEGFDSYEVTSPTPWNYALVLNGAGAVQVRQRPVPANPFETGRSPVSLQVRARRLPQWTLQPNGHAAFDPPPSPLATDTPTQVVELVPFGSQMLRVTDFPVVGTPVAPPASFQDDFSSGHADAWMFYGGGWFVREGELRSALHRRGGHAVALRAVFSDFVYRARVKPGETGDAGLTFRVTQPHIGDNAYSGYYVGLSAQNGQVTMGRVGEGWSPITSAPLKMAAGQSMAVRIEARGAQIRVWVGEAAENPAAAPLLEANDAAFASGAIGARFYGITDGKRGAAFSHVELKAL